MVFSTVLFLFRFLPITLALYYLAPARLKNTVLFLCSLVFYSWGEVRLFPVMAAAILINYTAGLGIERFKDSAAARRGFLLFSIIGSLGMLFFFKYTDFFINNINAVIGTSIPLLRLTLPLGISFYTFQTMSYSIDVYRGDVKAEHNLINFGAYVVMFPQLIAGPIVQYKTIARQMKERRENLDDFTEGIHRFVVGVGKKVLLANNIGLLWDAAAALPVAELPVATAWLGALAYTFQIYFDFSGYSDMAIGLGKMFGFHFLENFNYPYISRSITEFWRRWHISLSSWFREYVYIPLGGNRKGLLKQVRNIFVVWMLTGIWHGAHWNYVLWGVYYGVLLILEKFVLKRFLDKLPSWIQNLYTMFFVVISWVIFKCEDLSYCLSYLKAMFGGFSAGLFNTESLYLLKNYGILLVILILGSTRLPKFFGEKMEKRFGENGGVMTGARMIFYLGILLLSVAYLVDATYNPFLYFRF